MKANRLNKAKYKKYFFDGIENREELLEGILYFSYFNDVFKKNIEIQRETNDEKILTGKEEKEMLVQRATEVYKQFHRFIELNDMPNIYNYKRAENLEEIEQKIRAKIEELLKTPEYFTEEQIQEEIEQEVKQKSKSYYYNNRKCWVNVIDENLAKTIERQTRKKLAETKVLSEKEDGLSYSIRQRFRFAHYPEGTSRYGDETSEEYNKIEKHWTEDVYDILIFLEEAEKNDNQGYIDLWLRTRLSRATTCEPQNRIKGIEKEEISRLKHACKRLREIRVQENKIGHEELEIDL